MAKVPTIPPDDPKPPAYLPKRFNVSVGGFFSDGFSVSLENRALILQEALHRGTPPKTITPSPEAWQRFWDKLDLLGVWKWQKDYSNNDILDGTQWEIGIQLGKRRLKCDGSNSYPLEDGSLNDKPTKAFDDFQKAVEELLGIKKA